VSTILAMVALLLGPSPEEIVAYHDSGAWDADISRVIRRARHDVAAHLHVRRPAIVLDVDDTSLSSYRCLKRVDFKRAAADCAGPGKMPAIRQTRSLYRYARRHHVTVFFVTGRRASIRETTIANLHRAGYAGRLRVKLRPVDQRPELRDGWKARTRGRIERRGYTIVANVGDQRSDLTGRAALRAFKIPNPMYVIAKA
jgi:predicted secreted acid phosphatase